MGYCWAHSSKRLIPHSKDEHTPSWGVTLTRALDSERPVLRLLLDVPQLTCWFVINHEFEPFQLWASFLPLLQNCICYCLFFSLFYFHCNSVSFHEGQSLDDCTAERDLGGNVEVFCWNTMFF